LIGGLKFIKFEQRKQFEKYVFKTFVKRRFEMNNLFADTPSIFSVGLSCDRKNLLRPSLQFWSEVLLLREFAEIYPRAM
jgi:hypothetical protein